MPELPEVETTVRGLQKTIKDLIIKDVWTDLNTKDKRQKNNVANTKYFKVFKKEILGKKILSIERRAKNILINLSPTSPRLRRVSSQKTILIHMKMTGHLLYGEYKKDPINRFIHFTITFNNKEELYFSDMRKFGKITLLNTDDAHDSKHLNNIGPEPLNRNFKLNNLIQRLNLCMNKKIKTVLMDQSVIAGIGNIYSDEILWRAEVNPERKISTLFRQSSEGQELKGIYRAIKTTLTKGINFGGDSMSDYRNIYGLPGKFQLHHEAYRRTGERCRKKNCLGIIKRKIINGRSAHFCSAHQK